MKKKTILFSLCMLCSLLCAVSGFAQNDEDASGTYEIKSSPDGWATFSCLEAFSVPEGVEVYAGLIQEYEKDQPDGADYYLELHKIEFDGERYIPKPVPNYYSGEVEPLNPIILRFAANSWITVSVLEGKDPANIYSNPDLYQESSVGMLCGTGNELEYTAADGNEHYYVLGYKESTRTAFYEVAPGSTIPANRAYISIYAEAASGAAPRLGIVVSDEVLHIGSCIVDSACLDDSSIYTLQGVKVRELHEGNIYLRGNKKFVYHGH